MPCPPGWSSSASQCYTSPPVEGTWLECAALCTSHSWRGSPAALAVADSAGTGTAAAGVAAWTGAFAPNANISGCAYLSSDGGLLEAPCLALFRCVCQWPVPPSVFACSSDGPCSDPVAVDHDRPGVRPRQQDEQVDQRRLRRHALQVEVHRHGAEAEKETRRQFERRRAGLVDDAPPSRRIIDQCLLSEPLRGEYSAAFFSLVFTVTSDLDG